MSLQTNNVISGAEAFFYKGNHIGILICHGFNGTPQSVRFLGEQFANEGYTVLAPRLKGHGSSVEEFEGSCYEDWKEDLKQAYDKLAQHCSQIFVIGQSMGGTLSLDLASKLNNILGVITINAALEVPAYQAYQEKTSPRFIAEGEPDIKAKNVKEITHNQIPLASIKKLLALMGETKQRLGYITAPVLLFKSPEDHVVPAHCSDKIYNHVLSTHKEMVELNNSYHVASMDNDKQLIVQYTVQFIHKVLQSNQLAVK
ncbi:alpha/beta hydrolase [Metabacillus arenae]|uniref:Alpha/beta fold hydrolase n=1 Tax=Metabacillus arenae TaxID=2771434 RepID=A0A926NF27_9BACI|nr:alpha/beta fold hydrolase [Metabacillus arenae]MBD1382304.1 alpha/beta fold hydrolase [Metabacillus arenae]